MRRILAIIIMLALLMSSMPGAVSEEMEAAFGESLISEASLEATAEAEILSAEEVPEAAASAEAEVLPEITPEPAPEAGEPALESVPELMPEETAALEEAAELRVRIAGESRPGEEMLRVELCARVSEEGEWSYRWEYRDDAAWEAALAADASADEASFWQEISGAEEDRLEISARFGEAYAAYSYRCIVTDGEREAVSEAYKPETAVEVLPETGEETVGEAAEEIPAETPIVEDEAINEETAEEIPEGTIEAAEEEQPEGLSGTVEDEAGPAEAPAAPASLSATAIRLGVGEKYVIFPDGAGECSYASEDAKIAAVSKDGVITAKKAGETKITVSLGGQVIECTVTVVKAPSKVTLSASKLSMGAGQTAVLTAELNNGNESAVEFSSSKKSVATVDENGVITAHAKGSAKITAKAYNGKKASCTVTVVAAPAEIKLDAESLTLPAGMDAQLKASVNKGAAADYSYASSDESIAVVDAGGKVRAQKPGSAVITVQTYNGLAAECVVTVTEAPSEIYLNAGKLSLGVKETRQLNPTNDRGCEGGYSYRSAEPKVATVSEDGVVTAKKAGTTYISVTSYNGLSTGCEIEVGKAPSRVTLPAKSMTMGEGQVEVLEASLNSGSVGSISFSSSRESVAVVDENGVVTAVGAGKATITAKAYNGKKAGCTVTVVAAPESLKLAKTSASLPAGVKLDLEPAVNKGSYANYSCMSSDESVAVVNRDGVVTAVAVGTAVITVTSYNGLSAACEITVTPAPMKLEMNEKELTLGLKEKFQLEAVSDFGSDAGITYKSGKTSVASVDANGVVTAKKTGTAVITASTFNGVTAECIVTVKKAPSSIKFAEKELMLTEGQSARLEWTLSSGSAGAVSFKSDSNCVSVDAEGRVTAVSEGTAEIIATTFNGKRASCMVNVISPDYSVSALRREEGSIIATVSTIDACKVVVEVLSENGEDVLFSGKAEAGSELKLAEVAVTMKGKFPAYFMLRAQLQDAEGNTLSSSYTTKRYTRAYQDFESQKPSDFPSEKVLDFGDAGYGVLVDDIIRISGPVQEAGDSYSFVTDAQLAPGSVLLIDGEPIKVKTVVPNEDGSITITRDSEVYLADFYQVLKLDASVNLGNGAMAADFEYDDENPLFSLEESYEGEYLTAHASFFVNLRVKAVYDVKIFGKDYFEFETAINGAGGASLTLTGGYSETFDLPLYSGKVPIGTTGLIAHLDLTVPLEISAEATGHAQAGFTFDLGFSYDPNSGFQPIKNRSVGAEARVEGEFSIKTGPQLVMRVPVLDMIEGSVSGWVGAIIKGELENMNTDEKLPDREGKLHACDACVDIDINAFANVNANLSYDISEDFNGELFNKDILDLEWHVGDAFLSILNEVQSIHGGKVTFGLGECRNYKYRVQVSALDMDGRELKGVPLTLTGSKINTLAATSPAEAMLYEGAYSVHAQFESADADKAFNVAGKARNVVVEEPAAEVSGTVTDHKTGKPIKGATVVITASNGGTRRMSTDSNGQYSFDRLRAGEYSFDFSANGYKSREDVAVRLYAGTVNAVNAALEPVDKLPVLHAKLQRDGRTRTLTPISGGASADVPKITAYFGYMDYRYGSVTITHENCKKPYTYEVNGYSFGSVDVYAVPTEYGYTIYFNAHGVGTGMDSDIVVLQENNGVLREIWSHDDVKGIDVEGSFSSQMDFSGKIMPKGVKFSGTMLEEYRYDWIKRKGLKLNTHGAYMSYKENEEDGSYELEYSLIVDTSYNWDDIGGCVTRYSIGKGKLTMEKQWFETTVAKLK